jgi:hypothetical protein
MTRQRRDIFERPPPDAELEQENAERKDVGPRVDLGRPTVLLGGHVCRSTEDHTNRLRAGIRLHGARDSEVGDDHSAIASDHDVSRLQISMYDADVVRGRQAFAQRKSNPEHARQRHRVDRHQVF